MRIFLVLESRIYIANQVVSYIVADDNCLDFSILGVLAEHVLVERIKVRLDLGLGKLIVRIVRWILIKIWTKYSLRVRWFDVLPRAPVAVSTCPDFEVE